MQPDELPDMLLAVEVAELFGVTPSTIQRWAAAGTLDAIRPFGKLLFPREQPRIAERLTKEEGKLQE